MQPLDCDFVQGRPPPAGAHPTTVAVTETPPTAYAARVHLFFVVEQLFLKSGFYTGYNPYSYDADVKERIEIAMYLHRLWISTDVELTRPACLASTSAPSAPQAPE